MRNTRLILRYEDRKYSGFVVSPIIIQSLTTHLGSRIVPSMVAQMDMRSCTQRTPNINYLDQFSGTYAGTPFEVE